MLLASCAISSPLGPIFGGGDDDKPTASVSPRDNRFSTDLTDEDWRQVRIATEMALSPGANGRAAQWTNLLSKREGSVTATSQPAVEGTRRCRTFDALVQAPDRSQKWYRGKACEAGAGSWAIVSTEPEITPAPQPMPPPLSGQL